MSILNFSGISFPVKLVDIPKFEKQNEISDNVFGYEKSKVFPIHFTRVDPLYCFLDNSNRSRAVLTASLAPRKSSALGPIPTQPNTHRNKTVNVYKIKHIYIVLVFPTKSVFKP